MLTHILHILVLIQTPEWSHTDKKTVFFFPILYPKIRTEITYKTLFTRLFILNDVFNNSFYDYLNFTGLQLSW